MKLLSHEKQRGEIHSRISANLKQIDNDVCRRRMLNINKNKKPVLLKGMGGRMQGEELEVVIVSEHLGEKFTKVDSEKTEVESSHTRKEN